MINHPPQRVVFAFLAAALGSVAPAAAQAAAGPQLWRLAATTLATPMPLTPGAASLFWTPAQPGGAGENLGGIDLVQMPSAIGAAGFLVGVRLGIARVGGVGLSYGRMEVTDLVRTSTSPDPIGGALPYRVSALGATWSKTVGATTIGTAVRRLSTQLDNQRSQRWAVDGAVRRQQGRLLFAVSTHLLSATRDDSGHDVYVAVSYRLWQGEPWLGSRESTLALRYGIAFGRGYGADHCVGAGLDLSEALGVDILVTREGAYDGAGWRPAAGARLTVGRYRVTLSGDAGVNGLGRAYRVGLEARLR